MIGFSLSTLLMPFENPCYPHLNFSKLQAHKMKYNFYETKYLLCDNDKLKYTRYQIPSFTVESLT